MFYHVSKKLDLLGALKPSAPIHTMIFEDNSTPRISFSKSIPDSLASLRTMGDSNSDFEVGIYVVYAFPEEQIQDKLLSPSEVKKKFKTVDAELHGEYCSLEKIDILPANVFLLSIEEPNFSDVFIQDEDLKSESKKLEFARSITKNPDAQANLLEYLSEVESHKTSSVSLKGMSFERLKENNDLLIFRENFHGDVLDAMANMPIFEKYAKELNSLSRSILEKVILPDISFSQIKFFIGVYKSLLKEIED